MEIKATQLQHESEDMSAKPLKRLVPLGGLEPPTSGSTIRRSNQLSYNGTLPAADPQGLPVGESDHSPVGEGVHTGYRNLIQDRPRGKAQTATYCRATSSMNDLPDDRHKEGPHKERTGQRKGRREEVPAFSFNTNRREEVPAAVPEGRREEVPPFRYFQSA